MSPDDRRKIGNYWVRFTQELQRAGVTGEWVVAYWTGTLFEAGGDDWSSDCFEEIDEAPITRKSEVDWGDLSLVGMLRQYSALGGTLAIGYQEGATMGAAADRIQELEREVEALKQLQKEKS